MKSRITFARGCTHTHTLIHANTRNSAYLIRQRLGSGQEHIIGHTSGADSHHTQRQAREDVTVITLARHVRHVLVGDRIERGAAREQRAAVRVRVRSLSRAFALHTTENTAGVVQLLVSGKGDNIMREKGWRCCKRGTQAT